MKKFLLVLSILFVCATAQAGWITLRDTNLVELGTASNPIKVQVAPGTGITLENGEVIDNSVDDSVKIQDDGGATAITIDTANGRVGIGTTAPSQELDIVGDIELENTTSSDTGVIYKGTSRFIHNFSHPTGDTAVPTGRNIFIGLGSGNFTMGSTATLVSEASNNVGIGYGVFEDNTTGSSNIAIGSSVLRDNTTGYDNVFIGSSSGYSNLTGYSNVAIGKTSLYANNEGYGNTSIGKDSLQQNTVGIYSTGIGESSLANNSTGTYNSALGKDSGRFLANGSTTNTTADYALYLGANTKASASDAQNEIVIGYNAIGNGSNSVTLGASTITKTVLRADVGIGTTAPTSTLDIDEGTGWGQVTINGSSGGCLMMRDTDDDGWTECSFLNGTMTCTTDADGVCDGS